jgi:ERCC4-related helicase
MAFMTLTSHHAKYFAYDLTRRATSGIDRLSMSLFDAAVDLNPHQIEAALFALQSPLSKGVILADEVGLGKTVEAGIVLCQFWAERKNRLLVICPASLCKQWVLELKEKFNLPAQVLDARSYRMAQREGRAPLCEKAVLIISFNYANVMREELKTFAWDLVVVDEAHKLRNAYRPSNKVGQGIRWATEGCRKLLLTATPLQNSLVELYGLSTLIDEQLFGDLNSFRSQYTSVNSNIPDLRQRLSGFCKRTLRKQVTEYIRYTERRAITRPFTPSDDEHEFYEAVSRFLQQENNYALPKRQRHLIALILRKLLASSSQAIAATLDVLRTRLETLRDEKVQDDAEFSETLIETQEIDGDLLDEILAEDDGAEEENKQCTIDRKKLREEIDILQRLATQARNIGTDTKTKTLLTALDVGFGQMAMTGGARKALIFTESRHTQEYLKIFLESNGYSGQVVLFNGTNGGSEATEIYERWVAKNRDNGRSSGSRAIDVRTALIEHFRDEGSILIATEAAAEGINLQFCSLVINYDLPWNPQRIEQRIGRCHRYGQRHDVVVINFLNERNEADRRVLELLHEKFNLFSGVFGTSDEVLGTIESGVDFEKRILAIYQECRTPEEIDTAFRTLQSEMDEQIRARMDDTRRTLLEHFDDDVHQRLRLQLDDAKAQLDRFGQRFWSLTRFMLDGHAHFDNAALTFDLKQPLSPEIIAGRYHLISKSTPTSMSTSGHNIGSEDRNQFLYRLSHPLGEHVVENAKALPTAPAQIVFDVSNHPTRIHTVEALQGKRGFLALTRLVVESYEREEYLLFSGFDSTGASLDQETMEKLFICSGQNENDAAIPITVQQRLNAEAERHAKAMISRSLEQNSSHFNQAREKLEKWADDMVMSAEKELVDTKDQIKALQRQARQAITIEKQHEIQQQLQKLERQQRRQRQEIFQVEDEIIEKRDNLIASLERRLAQKTESERLFTIEWKVI